MGVAKLRIDLSLLRELLVLPRDTDIFAGIVFNGNLVLVVDHPDIDPEWGVVNATFRKQDPVVFLGWSPEPDVDNVPLLEVEDGTDSEIFA